MGSFMCHLIATPEHCINPEHSEVDHELRHCADEEHIHEPEVKVENFLITLRHVGRDEMDDDESEESEGEGFNEEIKVGWSYNPVKNVMRLMQRTAQQMRTLQPTMEMRAKRNLADRDILKLLLYCDSGSCLNLINKFLRKKKQKQRQKIVVKINKIIEKMVA